MSDGRGARVALEAGFLVAVAAVLGVAHVRPFWIVLVMLVAWAVVAALEWAAWREEPHWTSGQPPRYYVPRQPLPPRPPSEELPAFGGYPRQDRPEPRAAEAPTWIATPELREELFGWPTPAPSDDTVEEPFPAAVDDGQTPESVAEPPLEAPPSPAGAHGAERPALDPPSHEAAEPVGVESADAEGPDAAPAEPDSDEPAPAAAPAWPPPSPAYVLSAAVEQESGDEAEAGELPEELLTAASAAAEPVPTPGRPESDAEGGQTETPGPGTRLARHRLDPFEAPDVGRWPWQRRTEPVAVAELPPLPRHVRIEPTDGDGGG